MLDKLKNLNTNGVPVDELLAGAAWNRLLIAEFQLQGVPVPKWAREAEQTLRREIAARYRADREAQARKLEKEIEELKSREEKRDAKQKELDAIRAELG